MILCGTVQYLPYIPYYLLLIISGTALIPAQAIGVQAVIVQDCHVASRGPGTIARNSSASSNYESRSARAEHA